MKIFYFICKFILSISYCFILSNLFDDLGIKEWKALILIAIINFSLWQILSRPF
jgi:hypothetical protein